MLGTQMTHLQRTKGSDDSHLFAGYVLPCL